MGWEGGRRVGGKRGGERWEVRGVGWEWEGGRRVGGERSGVGGERGRRVGVGGR